MVPLAAEIDVSASNVVLEIRGYHAPRAFRVQEFFVHIATT